MMSRSGRTGLYSPLLGLDGRERTQLVVALLNKEDDLFRLGLSNWVNHTHVFASKPRDASVAFHLRGKYRSFMEI